MSRCAWAVDPENVRYHDEEWGVPAHDDRHLFEMLILEGAQAGLSWLTILKKRENYRRAFANFEVAKVAKFTPKDVERLMGDAGIVRNRLKIESTILNAKGTLAVTKEFGSLDRYLWQFTNGKTIQHNLRSTSEIPVSSPESDAMSKDLKKRGFKFIGTTICYAFMQATGMVNDHLVTCPCWKPLSR